MMWVPIELLKSAISSHYVHEAAGGRMHIVLDDFNVEDEFIRWCLDEPVDSYPCSMGLPWCALEAQLIGLLLLEVPEEHRIDIIKEAVRE